MTHAEQKAKEAYPVYEFGGTDWNSGQRDTYRKGYEQGEQDLKESLLQWLEYTRNLWSQTIADSAALQALQMVIDRVKEGEQ